MPTLSSSSCSSDEREDNTGEEEARLTPVYLNVYDLTPVNNYLYWFGIGIFHSGIECMCSFSCSFVIKQTKYHIGELDKECLIYKEMSNSNSTRPFGMETKSKSMRLPISPKMDNIVLIE